MASQPVAAPTEQQACSTEVVLNRNMTTCYLELHIILGRFALPTRVGIPQYNISGNV